MGVGGGIVKKNRFFIRVVILLVLALMIVFFATSYFGIKTIYGLLTENEKLKEAITTLTVEEQIGYAKVVNQETKDSVLYTTLRFVETARDDKLNKILTKEYTIEGDIAHFDALIVKFGSQLVMDGEERSLYLWRRVYGESMPPKSGFTIEEEGKEPLRYADLLSRLSMADRNIFWSEIWNLANEPEKLKQLGVEAIYGNVIYKQLRPGLIYVFKIDATGQVYPETVPEM